MPSEFALGSRDKGQKEVRKERSWGTTVGFWNSRGPSTKDADKDRAPRRLTLRF